MMGEPRGGLLAGERTTGRLAPSVDGVGSVRREGRFASRSGTAVERDMGGPPQARVPPVVSLGMHPMPSPSSGRFCGPPVNRRWPPRCPFSETRGARSGRLVVVRDSLSHPTPSAPAPCNRPASRQPPRARRVASSCAR